MVRVEDNTGVPDDELSRRKRDEEELLTYRVTNEARSKLLKLIYTLASLFAVVTAVLASAGIKGVYDAKEQFVKNLNAEVATAVDIAVINRLESDKEIIDLFSRMYDEMMNQTIKQASEMGVQLEAAKKLVKTAGDTADFLSHYVDERTAWVNEKLQRANSDVDEINQMVALLDVRADSTAREVTYLVAESRAKLSDQSAEFEARIASARSVLAGLWKVEDEATALLMTRFYENLFGEYEDERKGRVGEAMPKAEALQEAKRWLREHTDEYGNRPYEHPYFWSAFVLIGDRS